MCRWGLRKFSVKKEAVTQVQREAEEEGKDVEHRHQGEGVALPGEWGPLARQRHLPT